MKAKNALSKRWLTGGIIFILTIIILNISGNLFPYTGLSAIVVIPCIIVLNGMLILGTIWLTRNFDSLLYWLTWTVISISTIYICLVFYPQEFRPNITKQIAYSFSAIRKFDEWTTSDLDLPFTTEDYSRHDCGIRDAHERYVVALYKFRKNIPLDGSFHVYREDKTGTIPSRKTSITMIEEIPAKLQTGQDKLIWWILEKTRK